MARSICSGCSKTFSSESAFNIHRVGSYGEPIYDDKRQVKGYAKHERRCLTEAEMTSKGMEQNEKGIWVTELFEGIPSLWRDKE